MSSFLRILLVTDHHSNKGGGAEKYFFTLKEKLRQQPGISVISMGFGENISCTASEIILSDPASRPRRQFWNMFRHPLIYRTLKDTISEIRPDMIHLHNIRRHTPALLQACRGYSVIQTVHDFAPICPTMTNIHRNGSPCHTGWRPGCMFQHTGHYPAPLYPGLLYSFLRMRKLLKQTVRHFIAPSPLLADYLQKNGFSPVTVIPPFLPDLHEPVCRTSDGINFLFVGRLSAMKGADHLLQAFGMACQIRQDLVLRLAGEGPLRNSLEKWVQKNRLEKNIIFLGKINDSAQLNALYDAATAVIFPSIGMESFGLVLTEAMQRGCPVIAAKTGAAPWLIRHGQNGLLCDPLEKGSLARQILFLADHPGIACQYGREAGNTLRNWPDEQTLLDKIIRLYGVCT